jgi:glycosyltransferase involved in cell wall biosynthesis
LISAWSPPVLAQHIARILAEPEEMRRRGLNGRRWFEERYNWDVEGRRLLDAVDGIIPGAMVAGT